MMLNTPQRTAYKLVMRMIGITVDAPDDFDEEEQRELYEAIGNECTHRAHAISAAVMGTHLSPSVTSPVEARGFVRQALRELSAAVGEVEGLASAEMRLQAAFTLVAALFPHKEEL